MDDTTYAAVKNLREFLAKQKSGDAADIGSEETKKDPSCFGSLIKNHNICDSKLVMAPQSL